MLRHSALALAFISSVLTFPATAAGFADCPEYFANRTPPKVSLGSNGPLRELCYDAFAILHSGKSKTPVFVVERLNRVQLTNAQDETRTNKFFADARLPFRERAVLEDYKGSGFDRGHMAPAADMPTATAMSQSFSLANMVPQAPQNNRRTWAGIEKATRKYAMRAQGDIYVYTGPVYTQQSSAIGSGVWVPTYLFKLVYDPARGKAWAHWVENRNDYRAQAPISYTELVNRTGIEFLPGIALH